MYPWPRTRPIALVWQHHASNCSIENTQRPSTQNRKSDLVSDGKASKKRCTSPRYCNLQKQPFRYPGSGPLFPHCHSPARRAGLARSTEGVPHCVHTARKRVEVCACMRIWQWVHVTACNRVWQSKKESQRVHVEFLWQRICFPVSAHSCIDLEERKWASQSLFQKIVTDIQKNKGFAPLGGHCAGYIKDTKMAWNHTIPYNMATRKTSARPHSIDWNSDSNQRNLPGWKRIAKTTKKLVYSYSHFAR